MNLRCWLPSVLSPLLLLVVPAHARDVVAPKPEKATPALWKVSDADTTIWLFGTVHILPSGIDWYNGAVAKALDGSDMLVTEIVDDADAATAQKIARIALADPPANLRETLLPAQRTAYEAALMKLGVPVAAFDANDPWFAAVMLTTLPLLKEGYGTVNGAEGLLIERARAKGLPHTALETAEYQLGLFDALPRDVQIRYLDEILETLPHIGGDVRAMVTAWKHGEADKLARLMNEDEADAALTKVLLVDRNKAWARWIEERLKTPGTVFVAVGAGHLAGVDSVQAQLAADRIKARRVR